jgi:FolB domain-containing protein
MADKIFIQNLRIHAILGVRAWERETPQEILVSVALETDTRPAASSDRVEDSVDYSALAKEIRAHVEGARRFTVEALAEDIAQICLSRPQVRRAAVRVEKPGAVKEADSVGVEIERP